MRKTLIATAIASAVLTACTPIDHDYHGSVSGSSSSESPAMRVYSPPITIEGKGESVQTVDLQSGGYTVGYRATSFSLIVATVAAGGGDALPIINAFEQDLHSGVSGTTTFHANGRTTLHVFNTQGVGP